MEKQIVLKSVSQITFDRAIARAKKENIEIITAMPEYKFYCVAGSQGDTYQVAFERVDGNLVGVCGCEAKGFCKHIAITCADYKQYLLDKKAAHEAAQVPPPEKTISLVEQVEQARAKVAAVAAIVTSKPIPTPEQIEYDRACLFG